MAKRASESYPNLARLALRDPALGAEITKAFIEIDRWRCEDEEEERLYRIEMADD
jgi:hypothetical protein